MPYPIMNTPPTTYVYAPTLSVVVTNPTRGSEKTLSLSEPGGAHEARESVILSGLGATAPSLIETPTVSENPGAPTLDPNNMSAGPGIIAGPQAGLLLIMDNATPEAGEISDHTVDFKAPQELRQLRGLAQALAAGEAAGLKTTKLGSQTSFEPILSGQKVGVTIFNAGDSREVQIYSLKDPQDPMKLREGACEFTPKIFGHSDDDVSPAAVRLPSGGTVEMEWDYCRTAGNVLVCQISNEDLDALSRYGRQLNESAV